MTRGAFVDAVDLRVGDRLQTADGGEATVEEVTPYHSTEVTYDLTIDELHTYYVVAGDTPVLVHNCGVDGVPSSRGPAGRPAAVDVESAQSGWTVEGRLQLAQQRVPAYALFNRTAATSNRSYVGAVNTETGDIALASSGGGPGGCAGHCAEGNALMALGGDPAKVMFTEAFTVNRGADGAYQAVPKPVCAACQSDFPDRSAFAPGVTGAPGGAWGEGG